ncbi:hypothetical protein [Nonlabens xiamenensis]|uniref:hypothetical protein n=1 Tax=Nonlabens xiamenensis TaxID=2341043 RepID=UPI000F60B9DE|nr:hypothetical protein [Nonlabens xiamenensis]
MKQNQIDQIIAQLKNQSISFDRGLSSEEIYRIKKQFEIVFPADLKMFLCAALPVNPGFVHWRYALNSEKGKAELERRLNAPLEGLLFDIKHNSFWFKHWGTQPDSFEEKKRVVIDDMARQPLLIPIYSHRYMPSAPTEPGNPVYSVYQTDIIRYGVDLIDYFKNEFGVAGLHPQNFSHTEKRIDFWDDLVDFNNSQEGNN